jgi:hypothetical protein
MERKTSALIAVGTVATALSIGAAMQFWPAHNATDSAQSPMIVTEIQEVSSIPRAPIPMDVVLEASLPVSLVSNPVDAAEPENIVLPEAPNTTGFACDVKMSAAPAAGAMMLVKLSAPCHGSERVTLHHNGLMFTDLVQPDGTLDVEIPALAEAALVIASFFDGSGAVAQTTVTSVPFYDRVVLQWRGDAGLQLHAREFDAEYFSDGHVWQGAKTDAARAATGEGGFMTTLGHADAPDALLAEVYTFPTGMTEAAGTVTLTVEAEIQATNCESVVEAQTLEIRDGKDLRARELTIDVPGCDTVGDFLMLKNIVQDLTIAAK